MISQPIVTLRADQALKPSTRVTVTVEPPVNFKWGRRDAFGTPAFWAAEASMRPVGAPWRSHVADDPECLIRDVAYCLLGGYRVRAEVNEAALNAVEESGFLRANADFSPSDIEAVLSAPLRGSGLRAHRYPFPKQKARRLSAVTSALRSGDVLRSESSSTGLRDALMLLPGIGPKTASWIVRNHLGADDVAIVDVHIERAGRAAGFFSPEWRLPRDYPLYEAAFLAFADLAGVSAAILDLVIWTEMRAFPRAVALLPKRRCETSSRREDVGSLCAAVAPSAR